MDPMVLGLGSVVILLVLIFMGVHVAIALGVVGIAGIVLVQNWNSVLAVLPRSFYATVSNYGFTVLPLFIIMGNFAAASGITEQAYAFASRWLSNLRAGLYLVAIGCCALFAAATGSSTATTVAVGKVVVPEMVKHHYNRKLSLGCVAGAGGLGVLIPPSIPFVVYGIATGESIGRLLLAGVFPGILSALLYMAGMMALVRIRPSLGPPGSSFTWKERFQVLPGIWGVAILFLVVIGGIYAGVFTATEAAAWGACAALILLILKQKRRSFSEVIKAGWDTAETTAMIFFVIMASIIFTHFLTLGGVIDAILGFVSQGGFAPATVLALVVIVSFIFGMFISATAALVLVAPLAYTVLVPLGFDGIWLGVIMVVLFELAVITPPVAGNVFAAKSLLPNAQLQEIYLGVTPFIGMNLIVIIILIAFPQIATWLPSVAFGK